MINFGTDFEREYFSLGGCAGPEMFEKQLLWLVPREYFSLGGCAGPEMLKLDISLWVWRS